jgi:FkbH-like protein
LPNGSINAVARAPAPGASALDRPATRAEIDALFRALLGRATSDAHIDSFIDSGATVLDVVNVIGHAPELLERAAALHGDRPGVTRLATAEDVRHIFRSLLKREIDDAHVADFVEHRSRLIDVIDIARNSNEMVRTVLSGGSVASTGSIDGAAYCVPDELVVTPTVPGRVLMVGSCMLEAWHAQLAAAHPETRFDFILFNNASTLPPPEPGLPERTAFQFSQIPLRSVLPEAAYLQLRYADEEGYAALLADCCARLDRNFDAITRYAREVALTTFIVDFHTIQRNPVGRMQPRDALSNLATFMDRLNRHLRARAARQPGVHVVALDEIAAMFGKKHFNEDLVFLTAHGAMLADIESRHDGPRLEPLGSVAQLYGLQAGKYVDAAYAEACAMDRILRQVDAVKLVVFDLDDTLWRGVPAELESVDVDMVEGWPIGLIEAVSYLWRRGILIAIVSKNDIANVRRIWDQLYGGRFDLDKFVAVKANWEPKAQNVAAIMREANLLPNSVLFVDDNPVERAAVKAAFPEIRVLDAPVASWRRILLWAPELQRATLTDEAADRTAMVQAQIRREADRAQTGHADFLAGLGVRIDAAVVASRADRRFERCFELLNKTNQFNTTGVRWTPAEMQAALDRGARLLSLEVADKYTAYGITGVLILDGAEIRQFVLSCRVFGLGVEQTAVALAQRLIAAAGEPQVLGAIVPTAKNALSCGLYAACGFTETAPGRWAIDAATALPIPAHVQVASAPVALPAAAAV